MSVSKKYFIAGFFSYVIWGFVPIFFKQISAHDPYEIIFYRIWIAAAVITMILSLNFRKSWWDISSLYRRSVRDFISMISLNVIGALLLVTNWIAYVYVINNISVNAGSFAYLILPIVTTFLAFFILKEKLNPFKWAGVILSGISCYLMAHIDIHQIVYIACITFSYSFYMITQKRNTFLNRKTALTLQMIIGALVMLIINPAPAMGSVLNMHFWIFITIIAVVFTITPLLLNLFALNGMESSQLAFLIYINPLVSFLIGIFVYNEKLDPLAVTAYALLAVSIIIFNWDLIVKIIEKSSGIKFKPIPIEVESVEITKTSDGTK
ncbi:EamA family transporter [bacterium]|nr:MAG: EamA family transporter [bacterium]